MAQRNGNMVAVAVLVAALTTACGVTGPKVNFGKADGTILSAQGPGISGNVTDPRTGAVVTSGSIYFDPAALAAMVMDFVGGLFHKGADASKSVGTGA